MSTSISQSAECEEQSALSDHSVQCEDQYTTDDQTEIYNRDVTVKFQVDNGQCIAQTYPITLYVSEIKKDIASKFQVKAEDIVFKQRNELIPANLTLNDVVMTNEFGVVEIQLDLTDEAIDNDVTLETNVYYSQFPLNDIITVHVPCEMSRDGCAKDLIVEIENKSIPKPFVGGYRHIYTGIEYHDAFSQTGPSEKLIRSLSEKLSRDTQTVDVVTAAADTAADNAVQCYGDARHISYVPSQHDYVITAGSYESYDEIMRKQDFDRKIRLLQRNWRRILLLTHIKKCAAEYRKYLAEKEFREEVRVEEEMQQQVEKVGIKEMPKTKKDFEILFAQVQQWKSSEQKRITDQYSGAPKISELNALLDKEIKLLNGIDQQRLTLKRELDEEKNQKILDKLGKPVQWVGRRNQLLEMDTLRNQRARFLTNYFDEMRQTTKREERLTLLAKLMPILADERHGKVGDLMQLLQREQDLLVRGIPVKCIEALRKRQNVIFLDIIKDDRQDKRDKPKRKLCDKCKIVWPVTSFSMQTSNSSISVCNRCLSLNLAPQDHTVYSAILRSIRRDERRRSALASFAFIIQDNDIKYLVENIWHGHSILSQCDDRSDLRLPRFIISDDWSPWNCVLLTVNEARMHVKIKDLEAVYEDNVLKDINNKLELAKTAFKRLREVDCNYVESGEWWQAGMGGEEE